MVSTASRDASAVSDGERGPHTLSKARARAVAWMSAASAVVAAAVFAAAVLMPQETEASPSAAPLEFTGAGTLAATVSDARADLDLVEGVPMPERSASVASWMPSSGDPSLEPTISVVTWTQDLAAKVTEFSAVASAAGDTFLSGALLSEQSVAAGEFGAGFTGIPGESSQAVIELLGAYGMPQDAASIDVVTAIGAVLDQWTLTNAQHAHMLALLGDRTDVVAVGEAVDRFGRPVSGAQASATDGSTRAVLLISAETGRIVGVETITVSAVTTGAETATLAGYRLWDVDAGARR